MAEMTSKKYLKIQPELVQEVATGLEDGLTIAQRYGFSEEEWRIIEARPDFQRAVSKVRAELEKSGQTFRMKAALMADKLMDNMYTHAMDSETPVRDKATALQLLTRVGELEPKASAQVNAGPGFSITINLPTVPPPEETAKKAEVVEEARPVEPMKLEFRQRREE